MFNPFFLSGSKSNNFNHPATGNHPLPPCPDSPNCVRISKPVAQSLNTCWDHVVAALEKMGAAVIHKNKTQYHIDAVFRVAIYKDDFSLKLENGQDKTIIHIRSASREGFSDLGVNRRRVKRFLKLLETIILD